MTVQDLLDGKGARLVMLPSHATIGEVVTTLATEKIGTVMLSGENGDLIGIISERDVVRLMATHGVDAIDEQVHELMTQTVITCRAETSLDEVLAQMSEHTIRHMPVVDSDGVMGLISIRDILDFKCRRIITEATNLAEAASRTKSEFLANMGHELRTPLNAVIGFSKIMKTEALGPMGAPEYADYANDINEAGEYLLTLINNILDLSKVETGDSEIHEEKVSLSEAIATVMSLVRERAEKAGVEIDIDIEPDVPEIHADQSKLKRILANLLTNAIKFTDAGGKAVLKVWCKPESGLVIQIADTGIGIAPENIPKALAQFGQIDGGRSREYDGTGLGLPLTKALVELHGGTLDLQSEVGVGTTVTVRLPASRIATPGWDSRQPAEDVRKAAG